MPVDPGLTCGHCRLLFLFAGGPWVRPSPGIPCALFIFRGPSCLHNSGANAPRDRVVVSSSYVKPSWWGGASAPSRTMWPGWWPQSFETRLWRSSGWGSGVIAGRRPPASRRSWPPRGLSIRAVQMLRESTWACFTSGPICRKTFG